MHATITVRKETRKRLYEQKGVAVSYDEFITKLLDENEKMKNTSPECSSKNETGEIHNEIGEHINV